MKSYNIETETDFQQVLYNNLINNGLYGLKFENLEREVWLDKNKTSRIDIKGTLPHKTIYFELKDFRNFTISQIYYKLGDLFLQVDRYLKLIKKNDKGYLFQVGLLLPEDMPKNMISQIAVLFRARKVNFVIYNYYDMFTLNYEEIGYIIE